ncbi:MAG TPA: hypothetical protein VGL66_18020 [Caulobacteraceae bacterium]|jgi:hypothetical protein
MLRVAGQKLYPLPPQPCCDFTAQYMVYARLTADTAEAEPVYLVDSFRVMSAGMSLADRQQFFSDVMSGKTAPGAYDITWPEGCGYGYDCYRPQFYLPDQCLLAIHLDETIKPYVPDGPGIQNGYDEGDANAALVYVNPDGKESPTPGQNVRICYFSVVRRGATDMRGVFLCLDPNHKGLGSIFDPDGGNSGGTPYPPPGGGIEGGAGPRLRGPHPPKRRPR